MSNQDNDALHKTVKFVGFSGLVVLVGLAVTLGKWQSNVEQAVNRESVTEQRLATADKSLEEMNGRFNVEEYRISTIEKQQDAQGQQIAAIQKEVK